MDKIVREIKQIAENEIFYPETLACIAAACVSFWYWLIGKLYRYTAAVRPANCRSFDAQP
jgi:hypothetical protein